MSRVGNLEKVTQGRVANLFEQVLGYEHLGDWEKRENNSNIEEKFLYKYLNQRGYSDALIKLARPNQYFGIHKESERVCLWFG